MTKMLLILVLSLTVSVMFGGQAPGSDSAGAPPETITGCLSKGDNNGEFFIAKEKNQKVAVQAKDDLANYVGKQVQITATKESKAGKTVFQVSKIEVVAETCSVTGGA